MDFVHSIWGVNCGGGECATHYIVRFYFDRAVLLALRWFQIYQCDAVIGESVFVHVEFVISIVRNRAFLNASVAEIKKKRKENRKQINKKRRHVHLFLLFFPNGFKFMLFLRYVYLLQVSEISMPGILAASVFSAQNGEMLVFYQNSRLLILLCFTSGICRLICIKILF